LLPDDDNDFELLAGALRAETADLAVFVEALAVKLQAALTRRTKVVRRRINLLSSKKRVHTITVDLGEQQFLLAYDGAAVETRVAKTVRGIKLKSDEVGLDQWIDQLAHALAAEADDSAQGRQALERMLGVGG
jgi:hypothetical protein